MKIGTKHETSNDINYYSNYDIIFENNGLELDRQIPPINKLDTQFNSKLLNETDYKDKIDKLFQDNSFFNNTFSH